MNKVFAFLILTPFAALLLFRAVAFYEYDTKQRYLMNMVDNIAYKVKITGILTSDEYQNELKAGINKLAKFDDSGIKLQRAAYSEGGIEAWVSYSPGEYLEKGDAFMIYVESEEVSNFSRLQNSGVTGDKTRDLHYKAKAVCRVEKND